MVQQDREVVTVQWNKFSGTEQSYIGTVAERLEGKAEHEGQWGIRIREDDMLYWVLSILHIQRAPLLCADFAHKKRGAARWRNWGFYEVHAIERFRKFLLPLFRSSAGMALKFCRIRNMNFTVEKFHGRGKSLPLS